MKYIFILLFVLSTFSLNAQVHKYSKVVNITSEGIGIPRDTEVILVFNSSDLIFYKNDLEYKFKIISDIETCDSAVTNEKFTCFTVRLQSNGDKYWIKLSPNGERFSFEELAPNGISQVYIK